MSDMLLSVERRPDGVALLRLDRPKANALSIELLRQMERAVLDLADDLPSAVVVWGGERIFAAGADISEFGGPDKARIFGHQFRVTFDGLTELPRITIAAINGFALGGGCELALACDFRVMADTAKLGQPEVLLGLIPGAGGTQRLARLVGPARAKELIVSGRQVDATEALRIGLVERVVPAAEVLDAALSWAGELAKGPVVAHGLVKRAVDTGLGQSLSAGLDLEADLFVEVFGTEDALIGTRSFLERGPGRATFVGR